MKQNLDCDHVASESGLTSDVTYLRLWTFSQNKPF